ncbi:MAG TPA: peptide deformylase [Dysgonamonadaceae bacterium]|nr:peptide deformylase [Dysgonamonadaceae bacterium]
MILPIYIYGHPVLRKETQDIDASYPNLKELIDNMFETMYNADGVGLAGPQVGLEDRIFVIDLSPLADEENPQYKDLKKAFINARITKRSGDVASIEEGCLSIPGINESVPRQDKIEIEYLDENLEPHTEVFTGFTARVIQHEYDHIEGVLFIDHISAIRKRLIKSKLSNMVKGKVSCHYKVRTV